jgi:hypothetical protein
MGHQSALNNGDDRDHISAYSPIGSSFAIFEITTTRWRDWSKNMKTGTDAKERGTYFSECCDFEVEFSKDQTFTRCPKCSSLTTWELVDMDWPMAA